MYNVARNILDLTLARLNNY